MVDRTKYPVRVLRLDQDNDEEVQKMTPAERVVMLRQLTAQAWLFKDGHWDEPRLLRHVTRVVRSAG